MFLFNLVFFNRPYAIFPFISKSLSIFLQFLLLLVCCQGLIKKRWSRTQSSTTILLSQHFNSNCIIASWFPFSHKQYSSQLGCWTIIQGDPNLPNTLFPVTCQHILTPWVEALGRHRSLNHSWGEKYKSRDIVAHTQAWVLYISITGVAKCSRKGILFTMQSVQQTKMESL